MLTSMRAALKYQLRDALRASGRRAGDIAVQSSVSRQQMADLLRGRDGVTLYVITAVCDRLGLNIELRAGVEQLYAPGAVRTLVDDVRERLMH